MAAVVKSKHNIDGFEQEKKVVVIAATNRKQDLDPALISRFDSIITFGLPDQQTRQEIAAQYAKHLAKSDLAAFAQKARLKMHHLFLSCSCWSPTILCSQKKLQVIKNKILNEYSTTLKSLKSRRDLLYSKLSEKLVAKSKADDQLGWRVLQREKPARLREKLCLKREQYLQGNTKIEKMSYDLKVKYELLESAMTVLERNRVEQLEKFYPNLICTQSLGHMAITSERLHKQSVVIKQICKLFPQRRMNSCFS